MSVDWSRFKDGDEVYAVAEIKGLWDEASGRIYSGLHGLVCSDVMRHIKTADVVKRAFVPPADGKAFRPEPGSSSLCVSAGERGWRHAVVAGRSPDTPERVYPWDLLGPDIEELDV